MPSELRHILFPPAEVVLAVKHYHRRTGTPLPAGSVVRCGPECDPADGIVRFRITIALDPGDRRAAPDASGDGQRDILIEDSALAASLILFCRERRIPLPATAGKSLQLFGEQVCLLATINPKRTELPPAEQIRL